MKFTLMLLLALPFAALAQAPAKPEAAAEPAPTSIVVTKEEDVQMSEEEQKKAREAADAAARRRAAEDAAAERERQKEARMALCVIRSVMTDEQIDFCRVAYRD